MIETGKRLKLGGVIHVQSRQWRLGDRPAPYSLPHASSPNSVPKGDQTDPAGETPVLEVRGSSPGTGAEGEVGRGSHDEIRPMANTMGFRFSTKAAPRAEMVYTKEELEQRMEHLLSQR